MKQPKGGKAFIVVGYTGSGKSGFVKSRIANIPDLFRHIYDVNGEYYGDARALPEIDHFLIEADNRKDSVIVCEEATVFFSNRGSNKLMRKILVAKRHDRNIIYLLFHSIRAIPFYIYDLVNYVVVFNTNDSDDIVRDKHPLLYDAFKEVRRVKYLNLYEQKGMMRTDGTIEFWKNYQIVKL